MAEPSLDQVFPGASQTLESIVIPKAALLTLIASEDNSADEVAAGLVLALGAFYTAARREADPAVSIAVGPIASRLEVDYSTGQTHLVRRVTIDFFRSLALGTMQASDYGSGGG